MKRISFLLAVMWSLSIPSAVVAQDAATEEKLNQLSGKIEDLLAGQESLRKRISELSKEADMLREQQSKPSPNYASQEDLKRLAEAIKEVDRKRVDDNNNIIAEIKKLGKTLAPSTPVRHSAGSTADGDTRHSTKPPTGNSSDDPTGILSPGDKPHYEYVIRSGDTLSIISQAYKDKNIKVSVDQILAANPGLKAERLVVGKKINIPAPQQ